MGVISDTACSDRLEPGDGYDCKHCGQSTQAILNDSILECGICLVKIQDYDLVDFDRVQLNEDGRMSGRGGSVKLGKRPSRTQIGKSRRKAGNGRAWSYLERVNGGGDDGPTSSKEEAIRLVERHSATRGHERCALELLDLGWPDGGQTSAHPLAVEEPIWRPGHPHGVGSSAAACLHLDLATSNFAVQECARVPGTVLSDLFPQQVPFEAGYLLPPEGPGLGITIDESAAAAFPPMQGNSPRLEREDGSFTNW